MVGCPQSYVFPIGYYCEVSVSNSEDYLDGLLDSINGARSSVNEAARRESEERRSRIEQRNRIQPDDDFMQATGISGYRSKKRPRNNLREAFSETDFLRDFESELSDLDDDDADSFISDFEAELADDLSDADGDFSDGGSDDFSDDDADGFAIEEDARQSFADDDVFTMDAGEDEADADSDEDDLADDLEAGLASSGDSGSSGSAGSGSAVAASADSVSSGSAGASDFGAETASDIAAGAVSDEVLTAARGATTLDSDSLSMEDLENLALSVGDEVGTELGENGGLSAASDEMISAAAKAVSGGASADLGVASGAASDATSDLSSASGSESSAVSDSSGSSDEATAATSDELTQSDVEDILLQAQAAMDEVGEDLSDLSAGDVAGVADEIADVGETADTGATSDELTGEMPEEPLGDADSDFLQPEFQPDELDAADEAANAADDLPELLDENADSDDDLMALLSGDENGDFSDIGDLLNADENEVELEDSRESFEAAADGVSLDGLDQFDENGGTESDEKGGGIFAKILGAIRGIFSGGDDDDESEIEGATDPTPEALAAENADILAEFEEEEKDAAAAKADKKAKKAAEKEAKKKEKEAAKKEASADKDAKKKAADEAKKKKAEEKAKKKKAKEEAAGPNPKIPGKRIFPFVILAASLVVLIYIAMNLVGTSQARSNAEKAIKQGDYITAYAEIGEMKFKKEDDIAWQDGVHLLAEIQQKYTNYQTFMRLGIYDMAIDELVNGYGRYHHNAETAASLGIQDEYDFIGALLLSQLQDEFGLSSDEAIEIYSMHSRKEYTVRLIQILEAHGLKVAY